MEKILKVLFLASEADPFVKVGGLGDVAGSLPWALRNLSPWHGSGSEKWDIDIRLVIPYHGLIKEFDNSTKKLISFSIAHKGQLLVADIYMLELDGVPVYLISTPLFKHSEQVYLSDPQADGLRYAFFSIASLQMVRKISWQPDIVQANDWHTAAALLWIKANSQGEQFFRNVKTILGVHNLPYMGSGAKKILVDFGIPPVVASGLPKWAEDRFLPMGLYSADTIVTVSPTYAREIMTPEFGCGLEGYLKSRSDSIFGILNGIDIEQWNPESDSHIANRYGIKNTSDRASNKYVLQREYDLEVNKNIPLLAMVTRMDWQKGVDLLPESLRLLSITPGYSNRSWQLILLGTGDPALEKKMSNLQNEFPHNVRTEIRYDTALSHRIYAGADMLLIPSRYEPCGLTQMIAMRYGCVPIARSTGGLQDTIVDASNTNSIGFLFNEPTSTELAEAISRALHVFKDKPFWYGLQQRGMRRDFSWNRSAQEYLRLYFSLYK